jgi:hypothetical protein
MPIEPLASATQFMNRLLQGETVACDLNGERTYDGWVGVCHISGSAMNYPLFEANVGY